MRGNVVCLVAADVIYESVQVFRIDFRSAEVVTGVTDNSFQLLPRDLVKAGNSFIQVLI